MQKITPFLWFDGEAEEAVNFYTSVFKEAKKGTTTPGPDGKVMVATFQLFGQQFIALNGGPHYKFTEAVSFVVNCTSQDEIDYYWDKLSDGGQIQACGWLKDKYGLSWQIVPENMGELVTKGNAMQAMMQMKKIDIATLVKAGIQ